MKAFNLSIVFFISLVFATNLKAQNGNTNLTPAGDLPKVFLIGQHQAEFETLVTTHQQDLLTACNADMEIAFTKWMSMMQEMEAYSKDINFELDGIKTWFHVFWTSKGQIEHIAYHLRPNSKNIDLDEMNAFLISFINNYTFPLLSNNGYHHYTGANFPVSYNTSN